MEVLGSRCSRCGRTQQELDARRINFNLAVGMCYPCMEAKKKDTPRPQEIQRLMSKRAEVYERVKTLVDESSAVIALMKEGEDPLNALELKEAAECFYIFLKEMSDVIER